MKKNKRLDELLNKPSSLSEKFYHQIKIRKIAPSLDPKYWPKEWKKVYFKSYGRFEENVLPAPNLSEKIRYKEVLIRRKSKRKLNKTSISINTLSNLLYNSAGLKKRKDPLVPKRFYPSAGARYPLETYVLLLKPSPKLEKGIYHYYLPSHSLEKLLLINKFNFNQYFNQPWINSAVCLILITAIFKRTTVKYRDRGYNYVMFEAGHLGQNFYLMSTALGLSCSAIGAFNEAKLNQLLDIDGINESVIYTLAIG